MYPVDNAVVANVPSRKFKYDLRSDTVTVPTKGMYEAMVSAPVGDDVFADDPTIIELETRVAKLLNHEAGLFCASGTLANQLALRTHLGPLQSVLCDARAHVYKWEAVGIAANSGASVTPVDVEARGQMWLTAELVEENLIASSDVHVAPTKVVEVENTLNGRVMPLEEIQRIRKVVNQHDGMVMHLDGARLWNAASATGIPVGDFAKEFDSVSVCFSKGLGAPIGSVLVGSKDFIKKARHFRKQFGGGWRQGGLLAAACLYALDHHFPNLGRDHVNAGNLAAGLRELGFPVVCETNMLFVSEWPQGLSQHLAETASIKAPEGAGPVIKKDGSKKGATVRLVVHHQFTAEAVEELLNAVRAFKAKI